MEEIRIFDTTLRDGEQSTGNKMFPDEKIEVAKSLDKLGVNIIEAGFAKASPVERETIYRISEIIQNATVCSLARCNEDDIMLASKALEPARKKRIHLFHGISDIHLKYKHSKPISREEALKIISHNVSYAKTLADDIQFSLEDFSRTNNDYAIDVACEAIKAGATTINLPDTVGLMHPDVYFALINRLIKNVRHNMGDFEGIERIIFSCHAHNDLNLAVANTIKAIEGGVRQIEVSVNGIGERAGNADLVSVIMGIKKFQEYMQKKDRDFKEVVVNFGQYKGMSLFQDMDLSHISTRAFKEISNLVEKVTQNKIERYRPFVGETVFSHNSGVHQKGVNKKKITYEITKPKEVGNKRYISFSDKSGKDGVKKEYRRMGVRFNDGEFDKVNERFFELAQYEKNVLSDTFMRALDTESQGIWDRYSLVTCTYEKQKKSEATINLMIGNEDISASSKSRSGSIDACIKALTKIADKDGLKNIRVLDYKSENLTKGSKSKGETRFLLSMNGYKVLGIGIDDDVVTSTAKAYINGINKLYGIKSTLACR